MSLHNSDFFFIFVFVLFTTFLKILFFLGGIFSSDGFAVSVSLTCYVYCTICRHCNGFQNTVTSVYKILNTSLIIDVSGMCLNKPHSGSDECRPLENVAC